MIPLPTDHVTTILGVTTAISLFLAVYFYQQKKSAILDGDKYLNEAQAKGYDLLHNAMKKSQTLLGNAELEGVKMVAETKLSTGKMASEYQTRLADILSQAQRSISLTDQGFKEFIGNLQKLTGQIQTDIEEEAKKRADQMFSDFEERLSNFLIQTEQKSTTSIELELRSARQLIDAYKTQQLRLIDENIIAIMERTLNLVLNKKLSLKDQLELVYEALEKAKAEKFIIWPPT